MMECRPVGRSLFSLATGSAPGRSFSRSPYKPARRRLCLPSRDRLYGIEIEAQRLINDAIVELKRLGGLQVRFFMPSRMQGHPNPQVSPTLQAGQSWHTGVTADGAQLYSKTPGPVDLRTHWPKLQLSVAKAERGATCLALAACHR